MNQNLRLQITFLLFISISVSTYSQPLPTLWSTHSGGIQNEYITGMTRDAGGNIYITGYFESPSITFGAFILNNTGGFNLFVVKYDSAGQVIWAKGATGASYSCGTGIAADGFGNVVITGYYFSSPSITFGSTTLYNPYFGENIFTVKYDGSGNVLWARGAGDEDSDVPNGIASDQNGNSYMTGFFSGDSALFGPFMLYNTMPGSGYANIFIAKYDATGTIQWAHGSGVGFGNAVTTDAFGNVLYTGYFYGSSASFGTISLTGANGDNTFLAKLDPSGNVIWAKSTHENGNDEGRGLATDFNGNVYLSGYFVGDSVSFGNQTLINPVDTVPQTYFVRFDSAGNESWAIALGKNENNNGTSVISDANGNAYLTGNFSGNSITYGPHVLYNTSPGTKDFFILKYDSTGQINQAKSAGGTADDFIAGIALNSTGDLVLAGSFLSPSLTLGTTSMLSAGLADIVVAQLSSCKAIFTVYPDTTIHNWLALNLSEGNAPINYTWNWGDGTSSNGITPSHTYSTPAYYNICLTIADTTGCTSAYCDSSTYIFKDNDNSMINITAVTSLSTGINVPAKFQEFTLYPNPASGQFIISLPDNSDETKLSITDTRGQLVSFHYYAFAKKLELSTKALDCGVYFVTVNTSGFSITKKLVVVH